MGSRPDAFSRVVQQQREIEDVWVRNLLEQISIRLQFRIIGLLERIQFFQTDKGVFVGGVTMEILVLNEAGQVTEFRQIAPEKIGGVHQAENSCGFPFAIEHTGENFARRLAITKLSINEAQPTTERVR